MRDINASSKAGKLRVSPAVRTAFIEVHDVNLGFTADLLRILPNHSDLNMIDELHINLSRLARGYPSFAAIMCAWMAKARLRLNRRPLTLHVTRPSDPGVESWLSRIGLFDILDDAPRPRPRTNNFIPVTAMNPVDTRAVETTAEMVMEMVTSTGVLYHGNSVGSIDGAIGEVLENIVRHASIETPAFICAQYFPKRRQLGITIADAGIGIEESFRRSSNETARDRINSLESPLKIAIEPLMTSKFGAGHRGYGLFYSSKLCSIANGTFMISSGRETLTLFQNEEPTISHHTHWNGTIVTLLFDTTAHIDGEAVMNMLHSGDAKDFVTTYGPRPIDSEVFALRDYGDRHYTRESAGPLRAKVLTLIDKSVSVHISLDRIRVVTPSFADEFFGGLFRKLGERYSSSVSVGGDTPYLPYFRVLIEQVIHNARREHISSKSA